MKKIFLLLMALAMVCGAEAQKKAKAPKAPVKNATLKSAAPQSKTEKLSYAIGMNFARNFKANNIDIDANMMALAIRSVYQNVPPFMTDEEVQQTLQNFETEMKAKMESQQQKQPAMEMSEEDKAKLAATKASCKAWLEENKKRQGVTELPSGLQYEVITQGTGAKPGLTSMVTTHYAGTLINGKKFDSSYDRGQPAQFPVNGVIKGWTEALQLMNEGSKWKLYIPSDLAYGDNGSPGAIGPGETLIFEVELIKVEGGSNQN